MLIPEYKASSASAANTPQELHTFADLDAYKTLRAKTTDKVILVLFAAEWDESSRLLKQMVEERVRSGFGQGTLLFGQVDCDEGEALVEHFDIESVPSLVVVQPHKQAHETLPGVTPEQLTQKITEMDAFIKTLFEQEKLLAFRDIDELVKNNPCMMFIKGTLEQPKCKFTRRLVTALEPRGYRNIKTFNILEDERIRQWLKFYTQWPTFPQVYVEGQFQGGLDVVTELIEGGDFDDVLPAICRKLEPKAALIEFLQANKVVVFVAADDQEATGRLLGHFEALSVSHARVDLAVTAELREALLANAEEFAFRGVSTTQIYIEGRNAGSASELAALQESEPPTLVQLIPAGCVKETLQQRLTKLVKQHEIMLFMKGSPEEPQCQFSTKIVRLLNKYVGTVIPNYGYFDIFQDEDVRQGMKQFSNWPTFPQLYVKGSFVGGLDVCIELDEEGELEDALKGEQ